MYRSFAEQSRHYFTRPHVRVPDADVIGDAAWTARSIAQAEPRWRWELSADDVAEIRSAVDRVRARGLAMAEISAASFELPTLSSRVRRWRDEVMNGLGLVLVKGLPVLDWSREDVALAYWGLGHHFGEPGAQNSDEELLGHVRDYGENDSTVRLYRTAGNIDFHCDAADIVGLLCLRPAKSGGQSRIVSTVTIFNALRRAHPELVARLFEPFRLDRRDGQQPGQSPVSWITPCSFDGERLRTFYHSDYFRSIERHAGIELTAEERAILDFYDTCAADPAFYLDMWLEPGDMQFISNHTVAHARTAYQDHDDPALKRHLLRLWLSVP